MKHNEIQRLLYGPLHNQDLKPYEAEIVYAKCAGNSEYILNRCKCVLEIVFKASVARWPTLDEWRTLLPSWFVSNCAPEMTRKEADRLLQLSMSEPMSHDKIDEWTLSGWLHWFKPEDRQWCWWSSATMGDDLLRITVGTKSEYFLWGTLRWLLRTAGAISVWVDNDEE